MSNKHDTEHTRRHVPPTLHLGKPSHLVDPPSPTLAPVTRTHPDSIGGYQIRRAIGKGGMGIVYEAFDPTLRRIVAIKVLRDFTDAETIRRFQTEVESLAQLQHPNIVQVFDVDLHDQTPYVALEYMASGSLAQKIHGKPQPPAFAAQIIMQLADAAAHAHSLGILHRDLKPANILLTEKDVPKITDFGVAKLLEAEADAGLTRTGEIIGTPSYMSPEQARSNPNAVGPRSDVYSLGAILYELLTGRPPFTGVDPFQIISAVQAREPVPPRQLQPGIPVDLETICLKCLEKESERRYQSACALREDLERYLKKEPILARPAGLSRKVWLQAKRKPTTVGLFAGFIIASLFGLAAFIYQFSLTVSALAVSEENAHRAMKATIQTEKQRQQTEHNLQQAHWNIYRSKIMQARSELEDAHFDEVQGTLNQAPANYRSWEWYNLRDHSKTPMWDTYAKHFAETMSPNWINTISISPDDQRLFVGMIDPYDESDSVVKNGSMAVLSNRNGKLIRYQQSINKFPTWSIWQDQSNVIVCDVLSNLYRWNLIDDTVTTIHPRPPGVVEQVTYDSTNSRICRLLKNGIIEVIDVPSLKIIRSYDFASRRGRKKGNRFVMSAVSAKARQLIIEMQLSEKKYEYVAFDGETEKVLWEITSPLPCIALKFTPDSSRLISCITGDPSTTMPYRTAEQGPSKTIELSKLPGNSSLIVWDTQSWQPLWQRHFLFTSCSQMQISPDSRRVILLAHHNHNLHSFDVATGTQSTEMRGHTGLVRSIRFSPDGQFVVTACDDRIIRVWNMGNGESLLTIRAHRHCIREAIFTRDGTQLISGGADERIVKWDLSKSLNEGGLVDPPNMSHPKYGGQGGAFVGTMGFDVDGQLLILGTGVGVSSYEVNTKNLKAVTPLEECDARSNKEWIDYSMNRDGSLIFGKCKDQLALWQSANGKLLRRFDPGFSRLVAAAISPDGEWVATTGILEESGTKICKLICWESGTGKLLFSERQEQLAMSLAIDPASQVLAIGYRRHEPKFPSVRFINRHGEMIDQFSLPAVPQDSRPANQIVNSSDPPAGSYIPVMTFSPTGNSIVGVCWYAALLFHYDFCQKELRYISFDDTAITSLSFSPDGKRLATTGYQDTVHLYDTTSWDLILSERIWTGRVDDWAFPARIAFSPDNKTLAATHWNGSISIWTAPSFGHATSSSIKNLECKSAYQFHLCSAARAHRSGDAFAWKFQADILEKMTPPTQGLGDCWKRLKLEHEYPDSH